MPAYTITAPDYTDTTNPSAINRIQDFQLISAHQVRSASDGSTPAWELTFNVPSGLQFSKEELQGGTIAAGMQIALLPVNSSKRTARVLEGLDQKSIPSGAIMAKLPKRDGVATPDQKLTAEQVIAHTVDLTRPTKELLKLAGIASKEYDYIPVEEFLNLPGIKGRISFDKLLANQPPLANRKYTPSRVDTEKGRISILLSEVHAEAFLNEQSLICRGTSSGYLADVAASDEQVSVKGFLDLRKHKLPYDYEKPMVLLSTGVGVAPHLAMLREAEQKGLTPDVRLFLNGGRNAEDELCGEEIRSLMGDSAANYQYIASREGGYVQDMLETNGDVIWKALHEDGGKLYMCGLEAMKVGVLNSLAEIGESHGINGEEWIAQLQSEKRIAESTSAPDRFRTKWDDAAKALHKVKE
ncbi:MAG: hypothetical protein J0M34_02325 [Alphaproteobacteria bacterium]|nr:hypothetical protein [Alphaproteobacteria bacterium]